MGSSSTRARTDDGTGNRLGPEYFDLRRAKVDGFVARHFTWPGTLCLHGAALGLDILRAPVNVALSPFLVLTRIAAYLCRRVGWRGAADWLSRRRILLRTSVARRVEVLIVTDLLDLPLDEVAAARDPSALVRAVLAAPQFREMIRTRASAAEAGLSFSGVSCWQMDTIEMTQHLTDAPRPAPIISLAEPKTEA